MPQAPRAALDTGDTADTGLETGAETDPWDCGIVRGSGCQFDGRTDLNRHCQTGEGREFGEAGSLGGKGCDVAGTPSALWLLLLPMMLWARRLTPLLLVSFPAKAGVDAQLHHAVDGGDFAATRDADLGTAWDLAFWTGFNWGWNPVVLYDTPDGGVVLDSVQTFDFGGSVNLGGWARIGVLVPAHYAIIHQGKLQRHRHQADTTLWTAVPLLAEEKDADLAISLTADLPTGEPDLYLGDPNGGLSLAFATGWQAGPFRAQIVVGPRFQSETPIPGAAWGPRWEYGAGLRAEPFGPLFGTMEIFGATPVVPWAPWPALKPVEYTGMVGSRVGTLALSAGGGSGLNRGLGSPSARVVFLADWRGREVLDRDDDGIPDAVDICRNEAEDFDLFRDADGCPEWDNDRDGFLDEEDGCPIQPETFNGIDDEDGCPDGATQVELVVVGESLESAHVTLGEETFSVFSDEPAFYTFAPSVLSLAVSAEGFSTHRQLVDVGVEDMTVFVQLHPEVIEEPAPPTKRPQVLAKVLHFDEDSTALLATEVLDDLADLLIDTPALTLLRIEGHADPNGSTAYNYRLSTLRARAAMDYLVDRGVAAERLQAIGSGELRADGPSGRDVSFEVLIWDEDT